MTKVEQLIRNSNSSSWNFRITKPTIGKILEWSKLYGFIGSGNQITEKGLLLYYLMGPDAVSSIKSGDFKSNPFELTIEEKLYFLYSHLEADTTLLFLIQRLAKLPKDTFVFGVEADKLTCLALYDTFKLISEKGFYSGNVLSLKNLRELIGKIVFELDLLSEVPIRPLRKQGPRPIRIVKPEQQNRKRTNAADGEAIPRFEFLTDLGLLTKRVEGKGKSNQEKSRKAWKYWVTPMLLGFAKDLPESFPKDFCWVQFAHSAVTLTNSKPKCLSIDEDSRIIVRRVFDAFLEVKRSFGHTPILSVAIIAMIRSLAVSEVLELKVVHELFMSFKKKDLFSETLKFAAGNELDKMFIDLKPSFIEEAENHYDTQKRICN
jgi:hypothetical protein